MVEGGHATPKSKSQKSLAVPGSDSDTAVHAMHEIPCHCIAHTDTLSLPFCLALSHFVSVSRSLSLSLFVSVFLYRLYPPFAGLM